MSWSYNPALRLTVPLHEVRFLVGDTDTASQQLSDEDIAYLLTRNGNNVAKTAWKAAEQIVALYAKRANISAGPVQIYNSQKFQQYQQLAEMLKNAYLHPGGGRLADIVAGSLVHRNALGKTRLGPQGQWQSVLTETGTGGGTIP